MRTQKEILKRMEYHKKQSKAENEVIIKALHNARVHAYEWVLKIV